MAKNLTFIVIIVIVLWQIVYGLIQKAAKERQQDRMRQLAEQRRRQQGAPSAPRASTSPPQQPAGTRLGSRLEDLAARRKAQLEELRRRRASRPTAGPAQAGAGPGAPSGSLKTPSASPGRSKTIRTLKADHRALRESDRAEQRRQLQQQRRDREAIKARDRRELVEDRRQTAERAERRRQEAAAKRTVRSDQRPPRGPESQDAYAIREEGVERARRLQRAISSRTTLRDLFVVKELLDAPLALRAGTD